MTPSEARRNETSRALSFYRSTRAKPSRQFESSVRGSHMRPAVAMMEVREDEARRLSRGDEGRRANGAKSVATVATYELRQVLLAEIWLAGGYA